MSDTADHRVTMLLDAAAKGDRAAASELLPLVYEHLRNLARKKLSGQPAGQTLQATALVHEAFMRVVGSNDPGWDGRGHFFGAAALAMRNILVERARKRGRIKHGGGRQRAAIDPDQLGMETSADDILALDEALTKLEQLDARKAQIVSLRYFAGLSIEEIAQMQGVSTRTVEREWRFTRAWLARELGGPDPGPIPDNVA